MNAEREESRRDYYPPATGPDALPRPEERSWAIGAHLASVAGWVGVPMGHILAPLIVWLIKRDESEYVRIQSLESLNFQISMTLYAFAAGVLAVTIIGLVVAIPTFLALIVGDVVFTIIGAVSAGRGESYRYPMTIRLLK